MFAVGLFTAVLCCAPLQAALAQKEAEAVEEVIEAEEEVTEVEAEAEEEEEEISGPTSEFYGVLNLQGRITDYGAAGGRDSGLELYWGELGWAASRGDWSAHFSVLLDDANDDVRRNEAYIEWRPDGGKTYLRAGRTVVPFGNNPFYFPTYPASNDLAYSTLTTAGLGYDDEASAANIYVYSSPVDTVAGSSSAADYAMVWDITKREADECSDGWQLSAGYNSNLAAHDLRLIGDAITSRTPAMNLYGRYDWQSDNGTLLHLLADYTWALERFDAADLDADEDGDGDRPAALNVEFVYEPQTDELYGVTYQQSSELSEYANSRWGLLYGQRVNEQAMLKLEYTHGSYDQFGGGLSSDDTLTAELGLSF